MRIDWWTLALQAINFLALVWLLWRFLYRPVRAVIDKRKQLVEQAFADADARKAEAEAARQRFEEDRAGLAQERQDMLKAIHEELEGERHKVLAEARQRAAGMLEAAQGGIAKERETVLAELRGQVAALAAELASGLLRSAGPGASSTVFLEQIERRLEEMPAEERERLRQDLAPDGARLAVVTAADLTAEEQALWAERLGAGLGRGSGIDFAVEPDILGGAMLRFPHAVLTLTWADQLRKAEELLQGDETAS